jgi:hypothetical protein
LPALGWVVALDHQAGRSRDFAGLCPGAWPATALLALATDGMFHFRQRYALEIGETVVNGLRRGDLRKVTLRQPMSFFTA